MNTPTSNGRPTLRTDQDNAEQHASQEQTVSGNSSKDDIASAEVDSEFAILEADVIEHIEDVQNLAKEMQQQKSSGRHAKLDFEKRMAVVAAKFAPLYARISAMPLEERRAFLSAPATQGGVEKKWPDARAVDPDAVMMVHRYLFDGMKTRAGTIKVLCNRIGYTAAGLAKVNKLEFNDAHRFVMENGMCAKLSLDYTATMRNKLKVGMAVLDAKPSKFSFKTQTDDGFSIGSYRAILIRKAEEARYDVIDDLAPDEKSLSRIIERYYSCGKESKNKDGEAPSEDSDIQVRAVRVLSIEWSSNFRSNPSGGCSNAGADCVNCYALRFSARQQGRKTPKYEGTTRTDEHGRLQWTGRVNWDSDAARQPLSWKKGRLIFVNSMSDLGHPRIELKNLIEMLDIIEQTADRHVFQVLTKRPNIIAMRLKSLGRRWPRNAWLGTSVGVRKGLHRIAELQEIDAKRFLSLEPLVEDLGPLDLTGIDWVIAGGESGPRSRIRKPEPGWFRGLRDQCQESQIPFFYKQWGDWGFNPLTAEYGEKKAKSIEREMGDASSHGGALLDGRLWREMPREMAEVLRIP